MTALAQAEQLQYFVNVEVERTALIVPIQAWEQILMKYQKLKSK